MTAPDQPAAQPTSVDTAAVPDRPVLVDVIDIRPWLAHQGGRIPNTPTPLVAWLHELIATVADDPELIRMARLAHATDHHTRFAALLAAAVEAGWDTHSLDGDELFERYGHDETFRTELHAVAAIAAYTATRADPTLPADAYRAEAVIPVRRQQTLAKAIEDHAPRYHASVGSPARYIADAHVPGGVTSAERDWISYYIAAHPDVLHGPVRSPADIDARNRALADQFDRQALTAFNAGDHQRALDLIDSAALHDPRRDWDAARAHILQHADPGQTPADGNAPTGQGGPAAAGAFPHAPHLVGEGSAAPAAPPPAAPPPPAPPVGRGTRR